MKKGKTLLFFTHEYPYGPYETYVENELKILAEKFDKIVVLPLNAKGVCRKLPNKNIEIVALFEKNINIKLSLLLSHFYLFISVICLEFYHSPKKSFFLKLLPEFKSRLLQNIYRAKLLRSYIKGYDKKNTFYYSFWTDDWATVLSILKRKQCINGFVSRVHGYDLYHERWPLGVIPFRYFQLKNVNKVLSVSKNGFNYLSMHYPEYKDKFYLNHLNVFDIGVNPLNENARFTIVSCSNLIPLKRIHLIIQALNYIQFELNWIHFGEGELRGSLEKESQKLPRNIKYEFKGSVSNAELLSFYKKDTVNLFINVSETEGLPVTIMEVISMGIPVMATDVGGTSEIVTMETGILVDKDIDPLTLADLIVKFKSSDKNTLFFRKRVKEFWKEKFDAQKNGEGLYSKITGS